ncbi:unnamed protein product [Amoebophrya sp. A25]|nr:unnamed protein product [Amoebophrya sp. A25]|eukprot:GSA25T00005968001.1
MMGSSSVNLTSSGSAGTDPSPMLQHVSPSTGRSGYYAVGPGVRLLQSAQKEQRTSQQLEMKPSTLPMGYTRSNSSPTTGGLGLDEFLEGDGHSHQDHTTNYNNQEYDGHGVGVAITSTRNGGRVLTSSFSRAIRSPTLDEAEDQYPKMISISNDSTRSPNKNRRTSASPPFSSSKNSPPFSSSKNAAVPAPRIGMIRQLHHDDNQLDEVENFESERPVDLVGRFFYDMDPSPSDDNLARAHLASSGRGGDQKSWEARKSIDYVEYILHSSSSSSGEEEGRDDTNTSSLTAAAEYFAIDTPSVSKQGHPTRGQNATSSGHGKDQQKNSGNRIDEVVRQEVGKERREALPQPMQDHEDNRTFIFEDSQEDIDQQRMIITEEHDIDVTQFLDHQHLPFFSPMEPRDAEATLLLGSTGEAS